MPFDGMLFDAYEVVVVKQCGEGQDSYPFDNLCFVHVLFFVWDYSMLGIKLLSD